MGLQACWKSSAAALSSRCVASVARAAPRLKVAQAASKPRPACALLAPPHDHAPPPSRARGASKASAQRHRAPPAAAPPAAAASPAAAPPPRAALPAADALYELRLHLDSRFDRIEQCLAALDARVGRIERSTRSLGAGGAEGK